MTGTIPPFLPMGKQDQQKVTPSKDNKKKKGFYNTVYLTFSNEKKLTKKKTSRPKFLPLILKSIKKTLKIF